MTCPRCGAPLARPDVRFCTRCGAPLGAAPGAPQPAPGGPQPTPGVPPPSYPPAYPPSAPPPTPPARQRSALPYVLIGVLVLAILGALGVWLVAGSDALPGVIARGPTATPTRPPTSTPAPTATSAPGISITIPGPEGTPTSLPLPIPIPGLSSSPSIPIPVPGASGTPPPGAKLDAEQAREKVKATLSNCRLLQLQIETAQVTFEPPNWVVTLPLSRATWRVDDATGAVTPDERAAERARSCRL